jgi:nucleotide-binding universal stress UspA family protein
MGFFTDAYDLFVIGLGSVSQRCAAAARCPVVLVKAREDLTS